MQNLRFLRIQHFLFEIVCQKKHKIGKTSKNSQLSANVHSQSQSTINCKNQGKELRTLRRIVTAYSIFEECDTV